MDTFKDILLRKTKENMEKKEIEDLLHDLRKRITSKEYSDITSEINSLSTSDTLAFLRSYINKSTQNNKEVVYQDTAYFLRVRGR